MAQKNHPKCTPESYFEFVFLARHRKCQDKVSQFSIVKGGKKAKKTVEALETRLTSVQTARRIFMHYLYHSKCKFCLALIIMHVSKILLQLWHNTNNVATMRGWGTRATGSHFGQDQMAHSSPLTLWDIAHILTRKHPERAESCNNRGCVSKGAFPKHLLVAS